MKLGRRRCLSRPRAMLGCSRGKHRHQHDLGFALQEACGRLLAEQGLRHEAPGGSLMFSVVSTDISHLPGHTMPSRCQGRSCMGV